MNESRIIYCENINIPELTIYSECNEAQLLHFFEPYGGIFIAETSVIIERAFNRGCEAISWLVQDKNLDTVNPLIERGPEVPVYVGKEEVLDQIVGYRLTRGVLCAMRRPANPSLGDLLKGAKKVAVLEHVMNPTNVGAIFRSAAALGVDAVLVTEDSADPFYRRAIRVSMGTVFQVPWTIVGKGWVKQLKEKNFRLISMALCENSRYLADPEIKQCEKMAIVLGSESTGISEEVLKESDYIVKIPMSNGVDSLNVAAASAVVFWELCKE